MVSKQIDKQSVLDTLSLRLVSTLVSTSTPKRSISKDQPLTVPFSNASEDTNDSSVGTRHSNQHGTEGVHFSSTREDARRSMNKGIF